MIQKVIVHRYSAKCSIESFFKIPSLLIHIPQNSIKIALDLHIDFKVLTYSHMQPNQKWRELPILQQFS